MSKDIKQELVDHYRLLRQYGLNDSHSGNASVRDGDTVWVTPTGCCADTLAADDLVACNIDGSIGKGASLDAPMHVKVYQKNASARAVLHSHGPHSVALTLNGEDFVPADFEGQYYFSRVPVINAPYEAYVSDSPELISNVLRDHRITIFRGHGVYAQADSVNLAYKWTSSLELSAKTAFIAQRWGNIE
ncbi:MAG: class II aldolase/adducin family protein [Gammaproteobacteria bacterium]|nr:class II aldolase/adducin family protein [Gammaproteobacteria bacterium]